MSNHKRIRKKLEEVVKDGRAYCFKHKEYIGLKTFFTHKCYFGHGKGKYCRYLEVERWNFQGGEIDKDENYRGYKQFH